MECALLLMADAEQAKRHVRQESKMKITSKIKLGALLVAALLASNSQALTIVTFDSATTIGLITPGTSTSTVDNAAYVNSLVDRSNGGATSGFDLGGQVYTLLHAQAAGLGYADAAGVTDQGAIGGDGVVDVTGYEFLIVKYDGAQGESYVFNVAGVAGDFQVPDEDGNGFGYNKYILFNGATTPPTGVPDGGATVAMIGVGLIGLGAIRRKLA
ncbi:MAG TPA: VPDSG-CTERM sorting domain-containing protein [Verrucomicrobiae bacterium]|nr:VPDSG-CTERM sorting domain-containing protein [Verrucomicrobiae bacterium]